MEINLKEKVALIGGSSKGIGKGCAIELAKAGANVIICSRNKDELIDTANYIKSFSKSEVIPIVADLSDVKNLNKLIDEAYRYFNNIDILVVNSGGPKVGNFSELSIDDWNKGYESVLLYVVELYKLIIPKMKISNWGRIINIASVSVKEPSENLLLSNVFRIGVVSLAKSISRELIANNITINNICPSAFKTDRALEIMQKSATSQGISIEEVEKKLIEGLPNKRFSTIDEIGGLVAFLCLDYAKSITGTTIQIDGGNTKGLL